MKKIGLLLGMVLFLWTGVWNFRVCGAEPDMTDEFLEELDLEEIDKAFEDLKAGERVRFSDTVKRLIQGELPLNAENLGEILKDTILSQVDESRGTVVRILILITVAAVFTNFVNVFEKSQAADISFYMMYLGLFTLLMQAFQVMEQITMGTLEQMIVFMKLLIPSYFLAAVFASGSVSGIGFYELTLGMILVIQWILKYAVIPAVNLYVLFSMVNHLTKEEYLSRLADLLKTFVEWTLKTLAALAIGVQTVQCLVLPAVDSLKTAVLTKTAGAVPGVGNIFSGVTEIVIGSAVLIKNAVGAAGLIFLVLLCMVPFIKLGIGSLLYRLMAAVVQPVSDKRMTACIGSVGEGAGLLMRVLLTIGILFFLSVAMATATIAGR